LAKGGNATSMLVRVENSKNRLTGQLDQISGTSQNGIPKFDLGQLCTHASFQASL
jgi:hypothetical protein